MSSWAEAGWKNLLRLLEFYCTPEKKYNKKIVTLQVRILLRQLSDPAGSCRKRASLSVPASMTLEAALGLTLFIFASVCLILPMKMMDTERKVQAALEQVGEDFSRYAYVKDAAEKGELFALTGVGDFAKEFCRHLTGSAAAMYAEVQVASHVDTSLMEHVSMARSQVLTDGEMIELVLDYEIRLPFPVLGLPALKRTAQCRRRAWIGRAGKDYDGAGGAQEDADTIVYLGRGSTRYHRRRDCHYLSNKLTAVALDKVSGLRSKSGKIYHACVACGSRASGIVYIMDDGESYHSDPDCVSIIAYVRTAKLSEVAHLGACSYCSQ